MTERKQHMEKKIVGIGVAVNFVLNFVLIKFLGIDGAAIATLITSVLTAFIIPYLFKETRENVTIMFAPVKDEIQE